MRTETIEIYQFDELPTEEAKQKAIQWMREREQEDNWLIEEARGTLDAFCNIFPVKWSTIDYQENYRSEYSIQIYDDAILDLTGQRLATYLYNNYWDEITQGKPYSRLVNTFKDGTKIPKSKEHPAGLRHVIRHSKIFVSKDCPLTGLCYDDSILSPIWDFIDKPQEQTNIEDLLNKCIDNFVKDVGSEIEARQEDENLIDTIRANEYEFDVDGNRY